MVKRVPGDNLKMASAKQNPLKPSSSRVVSSQSLLSQKKATTSGHRSPTEKLSKEDQATSDKLNAVIGKNFKEARIICELAQSDVAEQTGFSQQYLSLIESGRRNVTIQTLTVLARVVGVDVIDLLQEPKKNKRR